MMSYDNFLEELNDSSYMKLIKNNKVSYVTLKLTFCLLDKNDYIKDGEDSFYTKERYDQNIIDWLGDNRNDYGKVLLKYLKHYGLKNFDIDYDYDNSGQIIRIFVYPLFSFKEINLKKFIFEILNNFEKDYNVNDYNIEELKESDLKNFNGFLINFYENKNNNFDTSIFFDQLVIESWLL